MRKVLLVLMALALVVFFGANHAVHADSNIIPAIKAGGGWTTVVSYVNTMAGAPNVHATYQVKNMANRLDQCSHLDRARTTTLNDLTTTVISTTGGGLGTVFPAGDTVGSSLPTPPVIAGSPVTEGFLVLENYTLPFAAGAPGTLSSEAIIFNLASGFLYSQRGLNTLHVGLNNVTITPPACIASCNTLLATPSTAGVATVPNNTPVGATLTRFAFLPESIATTGAYVIAINHAGTLEDAGLEPATTFNLAGATYNARIGLQILRDFSDAYTPGLFNRNEVSLSWTAEHELVCVAQFPLTTLINSAGIPLFVVDGGWTNLSPRCRELEAGVWQDCDGDGAGSERGDAAIIYKVEFAASHGFAVTPQHQQWYTK